MPNNKVYLQYMFIGVEHTLCMNKYKSIKHRCMNFRHTVFLDLFTKPGMIFKTEEENLTVNN